MPNRHITLNTNDTITGIKTFTQPITLGGSLPSVKFDATVSDPTVLTLRKNTGQLEIYDEVATTTLRSLLDLGLSQDINISNTIGSAITYALSDHAHQGIHSFTLIGQPELHGDVVLSSSGSVVATQSGNDINIDTKLSTSTPTEISNGSLPGTSSNIAKLDHTHKGVHSLTIPGGSPTYGDILLLSGGGITLNQIGQDIELIAAAVPPGSFDLAGILPANEGGTGFPSYTIGDLLVADTTTTLAKLPDIATTNVLLSGGVSAQPSYGKLDLTLHTTGQLSTNLIDPAVPGKVLRSQGGPGPMFGDLDLANTTGILPLSRLTDNIVAGNNIILVSGGGAGNPYFKSLTLADVSLGALTLGQMPGGTANYPLVSMGTGNPPQYSQLAIGGAGTTGVLPIAKGGTNSGAALVSNRAIISNTSAIVVAPALTDGQLLIGSAGGGAFTAANLTAGSGISIVNAACSITVNSTGGGGGGGGSLNQCRLVLTNTELRLNAVDGNTLTIDNTNYPISIIGLSTTDAGLNDVTNNSWVTIFASNVGGSAQLVAVRALQPGFSGGISDLNSGVNKRLVGIARTRNGEWVDTPAQRLVMSRFNRRKIIGYASLQSDFILTATGSDCCGNPLPYGGGFYGINNDTSFCVPGVPGPWRGIGSPGIAAMPDSGVYGPVSPLEYHAGCVAIANPSSFAVEFLYWPSSAWDFANEDDVILRGQVTISKNSGTPTLYLAGMVSGITTSSGERVIDGDGNKKITLPNSGEIINVSFTTVIPKALMELQYYAGNNYGPPMQASLVAQVVGGAVNFHSGSGSGGGWTNVQVEMMG